MQATTFTQDHNPNLIIPAGGFGERFKNITREYENKPSAKLPTNPNYRIIGTNDVLVEHQNMGEPGPLHSTVEVINNYY